MRPSMFHISICLILLCLAEGRITTSTSREGYDDTMTAIPMISRKRTQLQIQSDKLEHDIYDEFGNNFFDEDNVVWNRILGQTSLSNENCDVEVDLEVNCYLQNEPSLSCKDYMDIIGYDTSKECNVPIVYEYVVMNVGTATDKITKIKTAINSERPFTYIIDSVPWLKRTLVPGQYLTATQTSSLDFCHSFNEEINFEVGIECDEGDAKMFYPKITFDQNPPSCNAKLELACEDEDGGTCVPVKRSKRSPQYKFTYKILNNGRHSINLINLNFATNNIQDTIVFGIERNNTNVSPYNSLSRLIAINGTSSEECLEVEARLKYMVIPKHDSSKICFARAQYGSSKSSKGKGKRKSQNKCRKGKSSKGGGKGKGKGSIKGKRKSGKGKSSKSGKGKGKGKDGKVRKNKKGKGKDNKKGKAL